MSTNVTKPVEWWESEDAHQRIAELIQQGHFDKEVCTRENVMKVERFARARANA